MLARARTYMTKDESEALDRLLEREGATDKTFSLTRTEPGEKGALRVEIGKESWHITGDSYKKQAS